MKRLELIGLEGIGEVRGGDRVVLICDACSRQNFGLLDDDVLVIAQKIVSKAEERTICLDDVQPLRVRSNWPNSSTKSPRWLK